MQKNATVDFINKELLVHGKNQYGDPIFRVVFSDEQTERREALFNDFTPSGILIRSVQEEREVQKYPWIRSRWILERWAPGELSHHESLVTDKHGVYICVYMFQDINGNYLAPLYKVCQIIVSKLLNPRKGTEALAEDEEVLAKEEEQEVDKILTRIKEDHEETQTEAETLSFSKYIEKDKRGKKCLKKLLN